MESVRKNLSDRWTDNFRKSDASGTEKPIQEMRKEEYHRYTENLKDCLETEQRVARVLDIATRVENPCYMLRTGSSTIFNFRWLNTLARIRSRFSALPRKIL